jgi:hypothetical protein
MRFGISAWHRSALAPAEAIGQDSPQHSRGDSAGPSHGLGLAGSGDFDMSDQRALRRFRATIQAEDE